MARLVLEAGSRVRWYRLSSNGKRAELVDALVVRRITSQSIVIRVAGQEHTVRVESLMPPAAEAR